VAVVIVILPLRLSASIDQLFLPACGTKRNFAVAVVQAIVVAATTAAAAATTTTTTTASTSDTASTSYTTNISAITSATTSVTTNVTATTARLLAAMWHLDSSAVAAGAAAGRHAFTRVCGRATTKRH
jgi:hypothetical protein